MNIYQYIDAHPIYTFLLGIWVLIALGSVTQCIMFCVARPFRHRNIMKHGWPPPHCDADGDFRPNKGDSSGKGEA